MNRSLAAALTVFSVYLWGDFQVGAQDTIRYLERATKETVSASGAVLEESPAQVVCKLAGSAVKTIPAADILDIVYDVPASVRLSYRSAIAEERKLSDPSTKEEDRKKAFSEALKSYREIQPRLAGEKSKLAERHVQFKIARVLAWWSEEDRGQLEASVAALTRFLKEHGDGWQVSHAAKLLAEIQLDAGNVEGARKTYQDLAATPHVPAEIQEECEFGIVDALIRAKKLAEAEARLQALSKRVLPDSPRAIRVSIYEAKCHGASGKLAEAVAQLESILAKTDDKSLKAAAYNALGNCYRLNRKPREALWPYLWVDVIYHQDRQEHAKAMAELAKLFEEQGNAARGREYRDRLRREPR
ncbi:MAG TPA: tetratricopeptide repeat protein [Gemmataceae bacterium]|nr:tetratricopeptide repeat protein [Gemmataceae bacterium]